MVSLIAYIDSFFRLHADLRHKLSIKQQNGKYILEIKGQVDQLDGMLPNRIKTAITDIRINISGTDPNLNLAEFSSCTVLRIWGRSTNSLSLVLPPDLTRMEAEKVKIPSFVLSDPSGLEFFSVPWNLLTQLDSKDFNNLRTLHLYVASYQGEINLVNWEQVTSLSVTGKNVTYESDTWVHLVLAERLQYLELSNLNIKTLDLSRLNQLSELRLYNLVSARSHHMFFGITILWPVTGELQHISLNQVTFDAEPVIFSSLNLGKLKTLDISNHMNSKVVIADLPQLESFKTSTERTLIGHSLSCYLLNLPNLQQLRTSYQVTQYLWSCPRIVEFGSNIVELKSRPHIAGGLTDPRS